MKFRKRPLGQSHKTIIPDQTDADIVRPKKSLPGSAPKLGKSMPPDWRRRWFLSVVALILGWGAMAGPAVAQNAPASGPVQFPASASAVTNASAASPGQAVPTPAATAAAPAMAGAPSVTSGTDTEDIHDIRGPISIPYEWLWAAYVAASLLGAVALYGLWRLFRRRAAVAAKLPFEIALERLEAARALMTVDTVREYAFTVSEIIRVYIEQCFGEKAAHRTTEEFLSDLLQQTGTPLAQHRRRLEDFLDYCDLMKFARWAASVREMESMQESARDFILDTRPRPEPAAATKPVAPVQPELVQTP